MYMVQGQKWNMVQGFKESLFPLLSNSNRLRGSDRFFVKDSMPSPTENELTSVFIISSPIPINS